MDDTEIVRQFLIESNENLDLLDQELSSLESDPRNGEILASVFRTIHTIKGTSGFLAFTQLEQLTHAGENLLAGLREGSIDLTPAIASALLAMADEARQMLVEIENTGQEGERDHRELISTLTRLLSGGNVPSPAHNIGEILVGKGVTTRHEVQQAIEQQSAGDPRHLGEILVEKGAVKPQDVVEALQTQQHARMQGASDNTIRVEVSQLDRLMDNVEALILLRNQIVQRMSSLDDHETLAAIHRLNLLIAEIQQNVIKTRTQAIGNLWAKFPRTVRDLAAKCGKQVRVEMEGEETELDRTLLEAIKDPLTHLVRNAVDHGIEAEEMRLAAGKDPEGLLSLRAFCDGAKVTIDISDDGNGLDMEKIRRKAIEKGLITGEDAARMSEYEIIRLVFVPGFSTAHVVTNVSGRGVGMDVVKTNIEKIGGTVDVYSAAGRGCTVRMKVPLTLAIRRNIGTTPEVSSAAAAVAGIGSVSKPVNDISNRSYEASGGTAGASDCLKAAKARCHMCIGLPDPLAQSMTRVQSKIAIVGGVLWWPRRDEVSCRLSGC